MNAIISRSERIELAGTGIHNEELESIDWACERYADLRTFLDDLDKIHITSCAKAHEIPGGKINQVTCPSRLRNAACGHWFLDESETGRLLSSATGFAYFFKLISKEVYEDFNLKIHISVVEKFRELDILAGEFYYVDGQHKPALQDFNSTGEPSSVRGIKLKEVDFGGEIIKIRDELRDLLEQVF